MKKKVIFTCLLATTMSAGGLIAEEKTLTEGGVTTLFSGKTVDYTRVKKGHEVSVYYAKDGSLHGIRGDKKMNGSWHVNDNGELCVDIGKGDKCRHIAEENGVYKMYKNKNGKKIHIATCNTFTDGNPNNY